MARLSVVSISTSDGYDLHGTLYEPYDRLPRKAVAIINAGAGVPRVAYEAYASWMAEQGTPTLTYDYRGVGGSRGESIRGLIASIRDWGSKDCAAALGWAHDRFPSAEVL